MGVDISSPLDTGLDAASDAFNVYLTAYGMMKRGYPRKQAYLEAEYYYDAIDLDVYLDEKEKMIKSGEWLGEECFQINYGDFIQDLQNQAGINKLFPDVRANDNLMRRPGGVEMKSVILMNGIKSPQFVLSKKNEFIF